MEPIYVVAGNFRSFTNVVLEGCYVGSGEKLEPIYTRERHDKYFGNIDSGGYTFNDGRLWELDHCRRCRQLIWKRDQERRSSKQRRNVAALVRWLRGDSLSDCGSPECMTMFLNHPETGSGRLLKIDIQGPKWFLPKARYKLLVLLRDYEEIRQSWGAAGGEFVLSPADYYRNVVGFFHSAPMKPPDKQLVWARDLVNESSFRRVKAWRKIRDAGWPIDPMLAGSVVDPELANRYQRENLTEGIPCVFPTNVSPAEQISGFLGLR